MGRGNVGRITQSLAALQGGARGRGAFSRRTGAKTYLPIVEDAELMSSPGAVTSGFWTLNPARSVPGPRLLTMTSIT